MSPGGLNKILVDTDPRLGEIVTSLVKHFHVFFAERGVIDETNQQWIAGYPLSKNIATKGDPEITRNTPIW